MSDHPPVAAQKPAEADGAAASAGGKMKLKFKMPSLAFLSKIEAAAEKISDKLEGLEEKTWVKRVLPEGGFRPELLVYGFFAFACIGLVGFGGWAYHFSARSPEQIFEEIKQERVAKNEARLKLEHQGESGTEEVAAEGGEGKKEEGHGESHGAGLFVSRSPIPQEIVERQDGVMEPGHDLVDPDIKELRSFEQSISGKDIKVQKPYRFVELPAIQTGTKMGTGEGGLVSARIVLEIDTPEAEQEVLKSLTNYQSRVTSLVSEWTREEFFDQSDDGTSETRKPASERALFQFKTLLQSEINKSLHEGHVTDVLIYDWQIH